MADYTTILKDIRFNADGLVPVIAQQFDTGEVLMLAWMNEEAVRKTLTSNDVHYYSRSRGTLWRKGESSGQEQKLKEFILDCDNDTILVKVDQTGVACHTGRRNCFFKTVTNGTIHINQDVITPEDQLYDKR